MFPHLSEGFYMISLLFLRDRRASNSFLLMFLVSYVFVFLTSRDLLSPGLGRNQCSPPLSVGGGLLFLGFKLVKGPNPGSFLLLPVDPLGSSNLEGPVVLGPLPCFSVSSVWKCLVHLIFQIKRLISFTHSKHCLLGQRTSLYSKDLYLLNRKVDDL